MKKVSILIPAYNEEQNLSRLYEALTDLMQKHPNYEWEILFVNDGSKDRTLEKIKELRARDLRICYVDLSRNFGKEKAMLAGFDYVTGDCMVIMDADLQHPPVLISEMLKYWEEGYDDIYGKRKTRGKESWLRKKLSLLFYSILQHSTRFDILPNVGDFRLQGFPTLIIVILFLGGVQLISLGIIGEYLGRIFNETKKRPTYVAREYNNEKIKYE